MMTTPNLLCFTSRSDYAHIWTMKHKTFVTDFTCSACRRVNQFDGADFGFFAATSRSVYCSDLLDFWLYHSTCLGGTFRVAYEMSQEFGNSPALNVFKLSENLSSNSRAANTCFSAFLRTLAVPYGHELDNIFRCTQCHDGTGRLNAIVMDGTATGILRSYQNLIAHHSGYRLRAIPLLLDMFSERQNWKTFRELLLHRKISQIWPCFQRHNRRRNRGSVWDAAEILLNANIRHQNFHFNAHCFWSTTRPRSNAFDAEEITVHTVQEDAFIDEGSPHPPLPPSGTSASKPGRAGGDGANGES